MPTLKFVGLLQISSKWGRYWVFLDKNVNLVICLLCLKRLATAFAGRSSLHCLTIEWNREYGIWREMVEGKVSETLEIYLVLSYYIWGLSLEGISDFKGNRPVNHQNSLKSRPGNDKGIKYHQTQYIARRKLQGAATQCTVLDHGPPWVVPSAVSFSL